MIDDEEHVPESLADFARSLSYGKRSDLSFKFLAGLDDEIVGDELAAILRTVGGVLDSGDPSSLVDLVIRLQAEAYRARGPNERYRYDSGPFVLPSRPVASSRVALLTSSGHFRAGRDPRPLGVDEMTQEEAERRISDFLREEPTLSEVPVDSPAEALRVRHGGYDVRGALADHNVGFPIDRMREIAADGVVGSLHDVAYSFVGACAQTPLVKEVAPRWSDQIASAGVDVILLVPV